MDKPRAVISAIIEKFENNQLKVFFQTRWKPITSPAYTGLLEIPAGGIDGYEDVYDSVKREVKEETGLDVIQFIDDYHSEITENRPQDKSKIFKPFLCQEVVQTIDGLPWVGFVFRCRVEGEVKMDLTEAKDPKWLTIDEIKNILKNEPETIFPLQFPVLEYYVNYISNLKK